MEVIITAGEALWVQSKKTMRRSRLQKRSVVSPEPAAKSVGEKVALGRAKSMDQSRT